jgi:hypothetical protein
MSKEMMSMLHALDFALRFPSGGLLLCLKVMTVNPVLVTSNNAEQEGCIVRGDLTLTCRCF